jgi:hypothetical protein
MVSISIDELGTAWDLDTFVSGLVGTCFMVGMFTGTLGWGYYADI